MTRLYAQGDILVESIEQSLPLEYYKIPSAGGRIVVAEGERSGHRHEFADHVTFFRDDSLAHDVPPGLYIGHVVVDSPQARLVHDEHAPIELPKGIYRIRRQRELSPQDVQIVGD